MNRHTASISDVTIAANFERLLQEKGLHGALRVLNGTTPYRLTGVYRFEDGLVRSVVRLQTRTVAGPAFLGLVAEAQVNPASREAFLAEFAQRRRALSRRILERAVARGQVRGDVDLDLVIDVLGGATTFRLLQGHAPLTPKFAESLVALVLQGAMRRPR